MRRSLLRHALAFACVARGSMQLQAVHPGVSGIALYLPKWRVKLEQWCEWTSAPWAKIEAIVGRSFRIPGPDENVYTMAASAVLRLIVQYDIDPQGIAFIGLGTESSTDNAAGAVIVKGMVDDALVAMGKAPLSRACEAPEFKQACLGGIYAMKAAARWLACEGQGRGAIVVSGDVAEYERGSSGEQTQGAGAVAMWMEAEPALFELRLGEGGNSAAYRELDFRKPFGRHFVPGYAKSTKRVHDFPVFNGKYSTACYTDAVLEAIADLCDRRGVEPMSIFEDFAGVFLHRPYAQMPVQAISAVYGWALARSDEAAFEVACVEAGADAQALRLELFSHPDLRELIRGRTETPEIRPELKLFARWARRSEAFRAFVQERMEHGAEACHEFGNLYTASLPAWLGAALDAAAASELDWAQRDLLAVGYGSGDAAEALRLRVRPGWREAAAKIDIASALCDSRACDLERADYEALHDGEAPAQWKGRGASAFVIESVGSGNSGSWENTGIERYAFLGARSDAHKQ